MKPWVIVLVSACLVAEGCGAPAAYRAWEGREWFEERFGIPVPESHEGAPREYFLELFEKCPAAKKQLLAGRREVRRSVQLMYGGVAVGLAGHLMVGNAEAQGKDTSAGRIVADTGNAACLLGLVLFFGCPRYRFSRAVETWKECQRTGAE